MNINAANAANAVSRPHFQPSRLEAPAPTEKLTAEMSTEEPKTAAPESSEAKGVLRLLQEGHFKGVADVRLRINFHEEISQLNSAATSAGAQAASESFSGGVNEDLATLVTGVTAAATEEQALAVTNLAAGFEASLSDLLTEASINAETDFATLEIALQDEAESFISQLRTNLELEPEDSALAAFSAAFAERLSEFGSSAGSIENVLPERSEPNGNGAAYAKFLAILEGLNKPEPEPELQEVHA